MSDNPTAVWRNTEILSRYSKRKKNKKERNGIILTGMEKNKNSLSEFVMKVYV